MREAELVFIHLSDIHFHVSDHGGFIGVDDDIRRQLLKDISGRNFDKPVAAILVTGDIAFSGSPEQYQFAEKWLTEVCKRAGCEPDAVMVVPGNHDVDRRVSRQNERLQDCYRKLRNLRGDADLVEARLKEYLADEQIRSIFFQPLTAYNEFARKYGAEIAPDRFYWERVLDLADYKLFIRGMNTVLISDENDSNGDNKLLLARHQAFCEDEDIAKKSIYLTMAHHPPEWLLDEDEVNDYLKARASIQLFGHKHKQRIDKGLDYIRLSAGATNPEEDQRGWKPCYNIISVRIAHEGSGTNLYVKVTPRVWHEQRKQFVAEAQTDAENWVEWSRRLTDLPPPPPQPPPSKLLLAVFGLLILVCIFGAGTYFLKSNGKPGIPSQINPTQTNDFPVAFSDEDIKLENEIPNPRAHQRYLLTWDRFPAEASLASFTFTLSVEAPHGINALAMKRNLKDELSKLTTEQSSDTKQVTIHIPSCEAGEAVYVSIYVHSTSGQFDHQIALANVVWGSPKKEEK